MKKKVKYRLPFLCLLAILIPYFSFAQVKSYSFERLDSLQKSEKKKIVVFLNTDWCTYCQVMKNTTFKDDKVINALNKDYYFVDFNAEYKRDIVFRSTVFKYKASSGVHQLAEELGTVNGKVAFPTICLLNENFDIAYQHTESVSAKELLKILSIFKSN